MKTRTKAALLGVAAAATLIVGAAAPSGAAGSKSFAYGFDANGQVKQPYVESTDGSTHTGGGHLPNQAAPLLKGGIMDLSAGNDKASAAIVNLSVLSIGDKVPQELKDGLANLKPLCDGIGKAAEGASDANAAIDQLNAGIDKAPGGSLVDVPSL